MLPTHHLPSLIPNRVDTAIKRLRRAIWQGEPFTLLPVEATAEAVGTISLQEARQQTRTRVEIGSVWGRLFDQRWCRVEFPPFEAPAFLHWRDQGEATLYLDGVPFFGFDPAHRYCPLPPGTREGWVDCRCVQSGIWLHEATGLSPGGSRFDGAFLCRRDEASWQAYHDLKCLYDLMLDERTRENPMLRHDLNPIGHQAVVEKASPFYRRLLRLLDEAVDEYDAHGPAALSERLQAVYAEMRRDKTFQHCVLSGHAHIDLVWLWPEHIGEFKAVHVFSTMNRLMDLYPEFRFAYSQPASYEAVQRHTPELYDVVRQRIQQGRWQATGAMYVESDTLLACGEALARSFVLGQEGFRQIAGEISRLTWLPDVFGYSGCLPQLMRLSGVEFFFTTKMTWNALNRFPLSSFVWRGNDGSEVVAHLTQDVGYVTQMLVNEVKGGMYGHQQADVHPEFLLPTGFGDGGGGTTDEMCERARRLGSLPGMPSMGWEHPEAFFERLARLRDRLPVHQGECYLEIHRGTYTTHGNLKEAFRGLERALQIHEAALCATGGGPAPDHAWKRLVFSQFHDYIPGTSIPEVYADGLPELTKLTAEQFAHTRQRLERPGGMDSVFNPSPLAQRRWIRVPGEKTEMLVDVPALSGLPVAQARVTGEALPPVTVSGHTLSNGLVELRLDDAGSITQWRVGDREMALAGPLGSLMLYVDKPANFDAWDIDRQTLSHGQPCHAPAEIREVLEGTHRAGLAVTRTLGKNSWATVTYRLEAGSPLVHLEIDLNWNEPDTLLKMHFPTRYAATHARFGTPFGSVLRPQVPMGRTAEAMWEVPFSRYLAVFDEGEQEGFFLVTESKYGATVRSGNVGLSLVRSPLITGYDAFHHGIRPPELARMQPTVRHCDIGRHVIRLAIGSYCATAPREQQPAALAETLFTPPVFYRGTQVGTAYRGLDGGESLIPAWAMPQGENRWVLRLHEAGGRRGQARVRLDPGWSATAVDLLGRPLDKAVVDGRFEYRPYEIISLLIHRSGDGTPDESFPSPPVQKPSQLSP